MQLELKKQKKKTALLQAAYELFLKKGVPMTSVGDITTRAGVAKGTFYLYFRDKDDILGAVSAAIYRQMLEEGYLKMCAGRTENFTENLILLSDGMLDYLVQNRGVLELLRWGGRLPKLERDSNLWRSLMRDLRQSSGHELEGKSEDEIFRALYCLLSMGSSVACPAILRSEPEPIEKLKPVIFSIIRAALSSET